MLTESNGVPSIASATTDPFTVYSVVSAAQTNFIFGIINAGGGTYLINFVGMNGGQYYVQSTTNLMPPINWETLAGSTNTVTNSNGAWTYAITNSSNQQFYRSAAILP